MQRIQRRLNAASRGFMRTGVVLTGALVGVAKPLIETSEAMNTLQARSGASADTMERFRQQAIEVGSKLPLSTAAIIRAQTAYIQLGNSIEDTLAATPGIALAAAAAEGVEVGDAARYASLGLRAFNLEAGQSTDLLDAMLKAETTTPATMREIGEALRFSAQAAADAGMDYQTYIATLGTLGGSGRSPEEASQGLNVIFTQLAKGVTGIARGGKMVTKALEKVGISREDLEWNLARGSKGFMDLLRQLQTVRDEYGQTSLTAVLGQLVGTSYSSAFSYLVQNVDALEEVQSKLYDSAGEGGRHAAIQMSGLSGATKSLRAQLDTAIHVLTGVEDGLEGVFRKITALLTRFVEAPEIVHRLTAVLLLSGPVLIGIGAALRGVSFALGGLVPVIRFTGRVWNGAMLRMWIMAEAFSKRTTLAFATIRKHGTWGAMKIAWGKAMKAMRLAGLAFSGSMVAAFQAIWASATLGLSLGLVALAAIILAAWKPVKTFFVGFFRGFTEYWPAIRNSVGYLIEAARNIPVVGAAIGALADAIRWVINLFGDQSEAGERAGERVALAFHTLTIRLTEWFEGLGENWDLAAKGTAWGERLGEAMLIAIGRKLARFALFGIDLFGVGEKVIAKKGVVEIMQDRVRAEEEKEKEAEQKRRVALARAERYGYAHYLSPQATDFGLEAPAPNAALGPRQALAPEATTSGWKRLLRKPLTSGWKRPLRTLRTARAKRLLRKPLTSGWKRPLRTLRTARAKRLLREATDFGLEALAPEGGAEALDNDRGLPAWFSEALFRPPIAADSGAVARATTSETHITVENIHVNVEEGEPENIAGGIRVALYDAFHNTAEDFDTQVDR